MKSARYEEKNTLDRINRLDFSEEKISETEGKSIEIIQKKHGENKD